jgi:hypothetical protein
MAMGGGHSHPRYRAEEAINSFSRRANTPVLLCALREKEERDLMVLRGHVFNDRESSLFYRPLAEISQIRRVIKWRGAPRGGRQPSGRRRSAHTRAANPAW